MQPLAMIGTVAVTPHLLAICASVLLCGALACVKLRQAGLTSRAAVLLTALMALFGWIFAHLCYCAFMAGQLLVDVGPSVFWTFWDGRNMLYGGMLGVALTAALGARILRRSPMKLLDAVAPAGALMIALERFAEGLAGMGFGRDLDGTSFFPIAVYDAMYDTWFWAVFMLEGLYALALFVWLSRSKRAEGDRARLLVLLYAAAQLVLESMRADDVLRWGFVRCSQVVSAVLVFLLTLTYARQAGWRAHPVRAALSLAGVVALLGVCMAMEFALERRIDTLLFLDHAGCYTVMTGAAAGIAAIALRLRSVARRHL